MGAVGESLITYTGYLAYGNAAAGVGNIAPKTFKFSETEYDHDRAIETIDGWIEAEISAYVVVDDNTVEFMCEVPPEQATGYVRTCGLFLDDGTLFMLAWPVAPFPPELHQRLKIQLVHSEAASLTDFQYLPWSETEQDISALNTQATIGNIILLNGLENFRLKQKQFNGGM